MAQVWQQRIVTIPWTYGASRGTVKMALGTVDFLSLPLNATEVAQVSYGVPTKSVSREMYPGGPLLTYSRPGQTITRTVGGNVSTAKTNNRIVLDAGNDGQDTIYVSGDRRAFVQWLKQHASMAEGTIEVKTSRGVTLAVLAPASPTNLS